MAALALSPHDGSAGSRRRGRVGGRTLAHAIAGAGRPVIVLVNGAGGLLEGWNRVAAGLRDEGTVFAYDRLGTGDGDEPDVPQTGDVIVATLRGLLADAGLRPPYVLVGHSLGGLYVNLYARQYPDEIEGVVLLEAVAPRDA